MASQTKAPGTISTDQISLPYYWANENNAKAEDGSCTVATGTANFTSDKLLATNFGFTIPSDATITGIQVRVKRYAVDGGADVEVSIFDIFSGTYYPISGVSWPTSLAFDTLGGSSNLWGWSGIDYSDVNSSDFGFCVQASCSGRRTFTLSIDYIEVTVYYTPAVVPNTTNFFQFLTPG